MTVEGSVVESFSVEASSDLVDVAADSEGFTLDLGFGVVRKGTGFLTERRVVVEGFV